MSSTSRKFYLGTEIDGVHLSAEQLHVGAENLNDLLGKMTYTESLFHILQGRKATKQECELFDLVLVAFHGGFGLLPPTTLVPRIVAGTGVGIPQALAAGYLASGPYHVGAIEESMTLYGEILDQFLARHDAATASGKKLRDFAYEEAGRRLQAGETIAGYGHPLLRSDPRPARLRRIVDEMSVRSPYLDIFDGVVARLSDAKGVSANIDGMAAAMLLILGFTPEHGTGLFLLARTAAMLAHVVEERKELPYQTLKRFMILPVAAPGIFNSDGKRLASLFNRLRDSRGYRAIQAVFGGRRRRELSASRAYDEKLVADTAVARGDRQLCDEINTIRARVRCAADRSDMDPDSRMGNGDETPGEGLSTRELLAGARELAAASYEKMEHTQKSQFAIQRVRDAMDSLAKAEELLEKPAFNRAFNGSTNAAAH